MTTMSATIATRIRRRPVTGLWIVAGVCWGVLVALAVTGTTVPGHEIAGGHATASTPMALAGFVGAWLIMVAAMMLPAAAPAVRRLAGHAAGQIPRLLAVLGLVWAAFGLAALAGDVAVHHVVEDRTWVAQRPDLVLAGTLALAGVVQLACVRWRPLVAMRRRQVAADAGGWHAGVDHSIASLVCDGPLMLVMFAVGHDRLDVMVAITVVMVAERHRRWSTVVATLTACTLVGAAIILGVPTILTGGRT